MRSGSMNCLRAAIRMACGYMQTVSGRQSFEADLLESEKLLLSKLTSRQMVSQTFSMVAPIRTSGSKSAG